MDGRRALVYSRIRVNELNPSETDFDRTPPTAAGRPGDRSTRRPASARLCGCRSSATASSRRSSTDLSAWELLSSAGRTPARPGKALHCRLGGDPATVGRRVGHPRLRGQRGHGGDVHGPLGAARAAEGLPYAPGCRVGADACVSASVARRLLVGGPSAAVAARTSTPSCLDESPELPRARAAVAVLGGRLRVRRARSRSSRTPSPCSGPQPGTGSSRPAPPAPRTPHRLVGHPWNTSKVCPFGQRYS